MFDFRGQGKRLAIAAMLFGISATVQAGENRLLYASLGDTTRAPIGWGSSSVPTMPLSARAGRRNRATS
ncbi:hypothetical protein ACVINU_006912 [Bradyrhizobium diazoefficiens]